MGKKNFAVEQLIVKMIKLEFLCDSVNTPLSVGLRK